jgi:protein SCO1/2
MTSVHRRRFLRTATCLLATAVLARPAAASGLPGDSIYHLPVQLTDQHGRTFALADAAGHPVLASMFYTSCQVACPLIVATIQETLRRLPADLRTRVRVLLVSFDPDRDSVEVLQRTARERGCDDAQWTLARTPVDGVRELAAALGVRYRQLPDGDFYHSSVIALLDDAGRVQARSTVLGAVDPALLESLWQAAATAP